MSIRTRSRWAALLSGLLLLTAACAEAASEATEVLGSQSEADAAEFTCPAPTPPGPC